MDFMNQTETDPVLCALGQRASIYSKKQLAVDTNVKTGCDNLNMRTHSQDSWVYLPKGCQSLKGKDQVCPFDLSSFLYIVVLCFLKLV